MLVRIGMLSLCAGTAAMAGTVTFDLDTVFTGAAPGGTGPWLRACFAQNGANSVRLTLTSLLTADSEFVSKWGFNLDPSLTPNVAITGWSVASGVAPTGVAVRGSDQFSNSVKMATNIYFDIMLSFATSNSNPAARFSKGDTTVIDFAGIGLTPEDFAFTAVGKQGQNPTVTSHGSGAHVQGLANGQSGHVTNGDPPTIQFVPVPSAGALAAAGLMALGLRRRAR